MIITEDFVLLNFPKTGTSFTRKIIKKVYKDKCEEVLFPYFYNNRPTGDMHPHASYSRIPTEHRRKTILSIVRNPFDRYVSQFFYKQWLKEPPASKEILKDIYPNFPKMEFIDFLDMVDRFQKKNIFARHNMTCNTDTDIGLHTIQFAVFHSINPQDALEELIQGKSNPLLKIPKIKFLRQEFLRDDLMDFLVGLHCDKEQSIKKIISSEEDENVSRLPQERDWRQYWTADLLNIYSQKEQLLLNVFPEYKQNDQI